MNNFLRTILLILATGILLLVTLVGSSLWMVNANSVYSREILQLREARTSIVNLIAVTVKEVVGADSPAHVLVGLDAGGTALIARITRRSSAQLGLRPGLRMWAQIKSVALLG